MPWPTGRSFAAAHNKKLKGVAATKAAHVATAMVDRGIPEGEAIATGNKIGNRWRQSGRKSRSRTGA